jgi:NADH-quinone oxidoreductase subunit F
VHFFQVESCGKCTPCREGTVAVREVVDRLAAGNAQADDLAELRRLSRMLRLTSFCGLGQSVAWPIDSALVNFASEFPSE